MQPPRLLQPAQPEPVLLEELALLERHHAAAALWVVVSHNDANAEAVVKAGGLGPLVNLAQHSPQVRDHAVATFLMAASTLDDRLHPLVDAGGVGLLIDLARGTREEGRETQDATSGAQ